MPDSKAKQYQKLEFDDPHFKLIVHRGCTSRVADLNLMQKIFHEEIEIKYFYEGSTTLMIGTETVVAHAGDITVVNPYEFHSTIELAQQIGKYHCLMFGLDFFTERNPKGIDLRQQMLGAKMRFRTLIRGNKRMGEIICRIAEEMTEKPPSHQLAVEGLMLELYTLLFREGFTESTSNAPLAENIRFYDIIAPALERIHTEYQQRITVDELAVLCNVSKYHFCRIFHQLTGQPPMQYLNDYRLKIAEVLLNNTTESIAQVAWNCGFTDESYFCRCFKKARGHSPLQTRAILSKK